MMNCSCAANITYTYLDPRPTPSRFADRKADNDIEGLGVVIGFTALSWITLALLVAYYIMGFDPGRETHSQALPAEQPFSTGKIPSIDNSQNYLSPYECSLQRGCRLTEGLKSSSISAFSEQQMLNSSLV
ncbi:hypothetical protein V2G26_017473 [Clonostachys chloroleuca]